MTVARLRRGVLAALGLAAACWGTWAYVAPRHFFNTFPGFGHEWTAAYPPYNEHLIADLGATNLTLGALLLIAAVLDDRRVTAVVVAAEVLFNGLHLAYHLMHPGQLPPGDYPASLVALALGVLVPLALLATYRWSRARPEHGGVR